MMMLMKRLEASQKRGEFRRPNTIAMCAINVSPQSTPSSVTFSLSIKNKVSYHLYAFLLLCDVLTNLLSRQVYSGVGRFILEFQNQVVTCRYLAGLFFACYLLPANLTNRNHPFKLVVSYRLNTNIPKMACCRCKCMIPYLARSMA